MRGAWVDKIKIKSYGSPGMQLEPPAGTGKHHRCISCISCASSLSSSSAGSIISSYGGLIREARLLTCHCRMDWLPWLDCRHRLLQAVSDECCYQALATCTQAIAYPTYTPSGLYRYVLQRFPVRHIECS